MFFNKRKEIKIKQYVIAICKTSDLKTKYGEYPCKFENKNLARQLILSYNYGWGNEILHQDENYEHKPANAWKIKNKWLIIEEKEITEIEPPVIHKKKKEHLIFLTKFRKNKIKQLTKPFLVGIIKTTKGKNTKTENEG